MMTILISFLATVLFFAFFAIVLAFSKKDECSCKMARRIVANAERRDKMSR